MFQSTPPSEERSDTLQQGALRSGHMGFNPRPPPKRGATDFGLPFPILAWRFQSTPPSEERSDATEFQRPKTSKVSIHAPLRREERPSPNLSSSFADLFQSTPPSEERSDHV